jgi:hypothetical protein
LACSTIDKQNRENILKESLRKIDLPKVQAKTPDILLSTAGFGILSLLVIASSTSSFSFEPQRSTMTNLLAIPLKKTYAIDIKQPVHDYLLEHGGTHPAAVKKDINQWQAVRQRLVGAEPRSTLLQDMLMYVDSWLLEVEMNVSLKVPRASDYHPLQTTN